MAPPAFEVRFRRREPMSPITPSSHGNAKVAKASWYAFSRTIDAFAKDALAALKAIDTARGAARRTAWILATPTPPIATPTFKGGLGFTPLCAFVDHGGAETGEPLAVMLRRGKAGSNTATDPTVIKGVFAQLPGHAPETLAGPGRAARF